VQDRPISQLGDKGVFVRALERALLAGEVDLAVHSLKDVPGDDTTAGLELVAFSTREDARDCLISGSGETLDRLPPGAHVGTSSLRRSVQLQEIRPDIVVAPIRGNVDSRLRKLREGKYDAVILAAAGLHRLGLEAAISEYLPVERFVPDAGQGIMAVQARAGDQRVIALAGAVDNQRSRLAALGERAVVRALDASCRSPVGAFASLDGNTITIHAMAATEPASTARVRVERASARGPGADAEAVGRTLGERLARMLSL
jgi:hydroxymethylbilane synthase